MQTVISSIDDKKSKELFYFLKFKEIVKNFPKGKLELSESPDFLILCDQNIIGIEMVGFYSDLSNNRHKGKEEDYQNKSVINELKEIYRAKYGDCYHSIRFLPYIGCMLDKISSYEKNRMVEQIQYRIVNHIFGMNRLLKNIVSFQEDLLDRYFHFVDIEPNILEYPNKWKMIETNFIGSSIDDLHRIINNKEEKVYRYKEKCSTIFLLIVSEGYHETQKLSSDQIENKFIELESSKFDKIFFFDFKANHYVEW